MLTLFRRALIVGMFLCLAAPLAGFAQSDDLGALNRQVMQLYRQGKYAEATEIAQRALELAEKTFGSDHPDVAKTLNNLAVLYENQGRYAEAELLQKRGLAIVAKALGRNHPVVGAGLNNLAALYVSQGRYTQAEPLYRRSLAITEKALGRDHPDVGRALNNLADLFRVQGRYGEAEPLAKRSLAIREKALGPDHPDVTTTLNNLAELYRVQGRYTQAEPLYTRSLAIREKALGPDHPDVGKLLNNLALLYESQGRHAAAEPLYRRSLAIGEKALGPDHPWIAATLNNLAGLYESQGRTTEAEPLYKRSLAIVEKALGKDHPWVGSSLNSLAALYRLQGRYGEAEPLYVRSLAIREKALGKDHPDVGQSLNNLAALYESQGRYTQAEPLYTRSLAITEKGLGPDHPSVMATLINLAALYESQGRWQQATSYYRRGTDVIARRTRRGTQILGQGLTGKRESEAARSSLVFTRLVKSAYRLERHDDEALRSEMFQAAQWAAGSDVAASLAKMAARQATGNTGLVALVRERQDLVTEWQQRDAMRSKAVAQAPDKCNQDEEAKNVARLGEIDQRIAAIDRRLADDFPDYAALANPEPSSIGNVQKHLKANEVLVLFLDTAEAKPAPEETFVWVVTKTESRWVRSDLGPKALKDHVDALRCGLDYQGTWGTSKGLLRCLDLHKTGYTQQDRWSGKPLPFDLKRAHALYQALFSQVEDLIAGKDLLVVPSGPLTQLPFQILVTAFPDNVAAGWRSRKIARIGIEFRRPNSEERQAARLQTEEGAFVVQAISDGPAAKAGLQSGDVIVSLAGRQLTSNLNLAQAVASRAPGETVNVELIRGGKRKTLSVILGTATIKEWVPHFITGESAKNTQWLAKRHAMTVLPSVSSLQALRAHAKTSRATKPFFGVGNPLLDGDGSYQAEARQARAIAGCATSQAIRTASLRRVRSTVVPMGGGAGLADLHHLRQQSPLPETADELCAVARGAGASTDDVLLGQQATETTLKSLSASGRLAAYKVLHFATHGALAGELQGAAEPGLILTPPETSTADDDGYLSASEIAGLKLDADWVILSACNTAAGEAQNAEALSGLGKAFFYAGARSLLVSHWYVDSLATVTLITKAFEALKRDPRIGRAAALRQAMLSLIGEGKRTWHPAYWAPFVVVGEGAG